MRKYSEVFFKAFSKEKLFGKCQTLRQKKDTLDERYLTNDNLGSPCKKFEKIFSSFLKAFSTKKKVILQMSNNSSKKDTLDERYLTNDNLGSPCKLCI